jgi:hypothetical protein
MANKKNSILDDILQDEQIVNLSEEENNILSPLLEEISLIEDDGLRSFVKSILVRSDSFWFIPSSFSGKYHPPDEHNEGGNVLHTKRTVRAAKILAESHSLSAEEKDIVVAACLLHDITKGKIEKDGSFTYDKMHPYTVGEFIKFCQEDDKKYANDIHSSTLYVTEEDVQTLLRLIRCHLGPWSPVPETVPITYLDMIVHLADNIASKVHYILDGDEIVAERWNLNEGTNK